MAFSWEPYINCVLNLIDKKNFFMANSWAAPDKYKIGFCIHA